MTEEEKVIELSDEIVMAIVKQSLGKKKLITLSSVERKIMDHPRFTDMKTLYINYLTKFSSVIDTTEEMRALSEFRYGLVDLYNADNKE